MNPNIIDWSTLLDRIKNGRVIPIIGPGLYRVDIEAEGKQDVLLYDYLAEKITQQCSNQLETRPLNFFEACSKYLEENDRDNFKLTKQLDLLLEEVRLTSSNPLWKLARIKNIHFFLTTVYDSFFAQVLNRVRLNPTFSLSYTFNEKESFNKDYDFFRSLDEDEHNVIFHVLGNLNNVAAAFTEDSILRTFNEFQSDFNSNRYLSFAAKLVDSCIIFLGFENDLWLLNCLMDMFSKMTRNDNKLELHIGIDIKKSLQSSFPQSFRLYESSDSLVYFSSSDREWIDNLFQKSRKDEIIQPEEYFATVFISFEGRDRAIAKRLAANLGKDGISVWLDSESLYGGMEVDRSTFRAINSCPAFLPLISENSNRMLNKNGAIKYHIREWEYAYSRYLASGDLRIIPVKIDDSRDKYWTSKEFYCYSIPSGTGQYYNELKKQLLLIQKALGEYEPEMLTGGNLQQTSPLESGTKTSVNIDADEIQGTSSVIEEAPQDHKSLLESSTKSAVNMDTDEFQRNYSATEEAPQVFISYAEEDEEVAELICSQLESHSILCWNFKRRLTAGTDWRAAIDKALEQSRVMVLIYSSNAEKSKGVRKEYDLADFWDKSIIPFLLNRDLKGVYAELRASLQCIDAYKPPFEKHIDELIVAVKSLLKKYQKNSCEN